VRELGTQGLSCRKIAGQMLLSKSAAYNVVHAKWFYQLPDKTAKNKGYDIQLSQSLS
jgi:hypothetical protein